MNNKINIIELSEASSLAKIISSKTAQNMIKYIGDHEKCTASQIKNDLKIPASSVHYNLKALVESKIIDDSEFTYSSKGKNVVHYSVSEKILIIIPRKQTNPIELKTLIPGILAVSTIIVFSFISKLFQNSSSRLFQSKNEFALDSAIMSASPRASSVAIQTTNTASNWFLSSEFILGLVIASICFIGSILLFKYIKKKRTISK